MTEIPEGFELYVDEDNDRMWRWRPVYVGPPPLKPLTLEEKVRDLAARFDRLALEDGILPDPGRSNAWRDAADDLRGLLDDVDQ